MLLSIAALLTVFLLSKPKLVLQNQDSGEVYAEFEINGGDRFSITFLHSVNKSPVTDVYEIRDNEIYVIETIYYGFGAGVQTQLQDGQTLTYTDDGAMVISGFNKLMSGMVYVVGKIYDHTMEIGGVQHSLTELCGKGSPVSFIVK